MATRERQRLLQEQYYFLCQCEACTQRQQQQEEEEEAKGSESTPQWSGVGGGLVCGKCKGFLKVGVDVDIFSYNHTWWPPLSTSILLLFHLDLKWFCRKEQKDSYVCGHPVATACLLLKWAAGCRRSRRTWRRLLTSWKGRGQVVGKCYIQMLMQKADSSMRPFHLYRRSFLTFLWSTPAPPSDEALRLLRRTQNQPGLTLAETHPLQGELADATARAHATMGENDNAWALWLIHLGCFVWLRHTFWLMHIATNWLRISTVNSWYSHHYFIRPDKDQWNGKK